MTDVFTSLSAWRAERRAQHARRTHASASCPTMGALHEGHLSLVRRSRAENDRTLVSIFVNPTQFDDPTDYAQYPRTLDDDLEMLRQAGADCVLVPARRTICTRTAIRYRVTEIELSKMLEGAHRPGHFDAVLTVVLKLLQIAAADRAYFGEKDWQQLQLVRGLADAFFLPTAIVACATVREADGLALSSRNRRLPRPTERRRRVPPGARRSRRPPTRQARSLRASRVRRGLRGRRRGTPARRGPARRRAADRQRAA